MARQMLTREQVEGLVGFKKAKIYALTRQGHFPSPLNVSGQSLWFEDEIADWQDQLERKRYKPKQSLRKRF